jgi:hypothetical protein
MVHFLGGVGVGIDAGVFVQNRNPLLPGADPMLRQVQLALVKDADLNPISIGVSVTTPAFSTPS